MCTQKLPTPFELGYSAKPGTPNPFVVNSDDWRHWNFGFCAADEERARDEDEREWENYFAWSNWEQGYASAFCPHIFRQIKEAIAKARGGTNG